MKKEYKPSLASKLVTLVGGLLLVIPFVTLWLVIMYICEGSGLKLSNEFYIGLGGVLFLFYCIMIISMIRNTFFSGFMVEVGENYLVIKQFKKEVEYNLNQVSISYSITRGNGFQADLKVIDANGEEMKFDCSALGKNKFSALLQDLKVDDQVTKLN